MSKLDVSEAPPTTTQVLPMTGQAPVTKAQAPAIKGPA